MFKELIKELKDQSKFSNFIDKLLIALADDRNKFTAKDGFVIGMLYSNSKLVYNALKGQSYPMSDNVIQQYENVIQWMMTNETKLLKIYKES